MIQSAVEGTLNVLRQAISVGARKFVMLSTWGTTLDRGSRSTWNEAGIGTQSAFSQRPVSTHSTVAILPSPVSLRPAFTRVDHSD